MPESVLSFIVPIYSPDVTVLDKALKALCSQSLKSWELIAVLDGPCPEARAAIARHLKKVHNRHEIIEIPHGGAQKARNEGFKHSKGNYVVFLDCDVVIEPHTALAWVEILDKEPEVGFVYSGYSFLNEQGAISSRPFDPYLLRVTNYISSCFPLRRELCGTWNEALESLQDWDWWLGVVEKGAKGKYLNGYAFSTAYPTPKSISGQGCTPDKWLERMDKVKAIHGIPIRETCVTSLHDSLDGIALAKALDADYHDFPNDKPNHYKTIIQIGFSLKNGEFERCASAWGKDHKKILFWTAEDVELVHDGIALRALDEYSKKLNAIASQFVEDNKAKEIMTRAGFVVEVLSLPVISKEDVTPLPESPKFLVDTAPNYGHVFNIIQESIPDIKLEILSGAKEIDKYTGLVCFRQDGLMRPAVKRILAAGRHVVSNIMQPFTGYMDDRVSDSKFIVDFVEKIRQAAKKSQSKESVKYWIDPRRVDRFKERVCC